MSRNMGASSATTGLAGAKAPEPPARIPSAVTIPGEVYVFLMGQGPLEGVWFGDLNENLPGRFWWRGVLRCAAHWPASAIEAGTGETRSGSTEGESAVPEGQTPNPPLTQGTDHEQND